MSDINEPSPRFEPGEWVDDDAVIKMVRETRLGILKTQLAGGYLPQDKDGFDQLHKNLQELSKDGYKAKQLQQEAKSSEEQGRLAIAIANQMVKSIGGDPFLNHKDPIDVPDEAIPQPTHLIGTSTPAPGELLVGDDTTSYAVFASTVGKAMDEARRGKDEEAEEE